MSPEPATAAVPAPLLSRKAPPPLCCPPPATATAACPRFINTSRPELHTAYRLATTFPPQQLDDDSATIQAAGLGNSVIIQKA